ncbi:MAG: DUF3088 domain-containing protein [Hyphomonadaceae bacterium]|nr:DUF3088 domain-containing protein [Hyphomonadaceae bacterium]
MISRDTLFLIRAPFEDTALDGAWFCHDCAAMEGALLANPHWARAVDVRRQPFPRPRHDIIALIGEAHQGMPVLVLAKASAPPEDAKRSVDTGLAFIDTSRGIARYLAKAHGGAGPHP